MNHYNQADWLAFIRDELEEEKRQKLENHLYSCDECLRTYMECIDLHSALMPEPAPEQYEQWMNLLTGHVLDKQAEERKSGKSFNIPSHNRIIPYVVAASITLLLTGAGVFESLLIGTETVHSDPVSGSTVSYSEKAVQTITYWLDRFKP